MPLMDGSHYPFYLSASSRGVLVDDTPSHQLRIDGEFGTQQIVIDENTEIPLGFKAGLPYFKMCPLTSEEMADPNIV